MHEEARGGQLGGVEAGIGGIFPGEGRLRHQRPHPGQRREGEQAQVVGGRGRRLLGVGQAPLGDGGGGPLQAPEGLGQGFDELGHFGIRRVHLDEGGEGVEEAAQVTPGVRRQLAPHQVQRLDAVGAFVDLRHPGVAHVLLHAGFPDVAVAAHDLDAQVGAFGGHVGEIRLDDRRQQGHQVLGLLAGFAVGMALGRVERRCHPKREGARAFDVGAHGQQHAAYVGMHDDGVCGHIGVAGAGQGAPLQALAGIGRGPLVGGLGDAQALDADEQARRIHHGEHGAHALVFLAHQERLGAVEVDGAGGGRGDSHLVLDGAAGDAVGRPRGAVGGGQELGHQEHADALDAAGRAGGAGKHQVHDVLRQVVLARRNEHL